MENEELPADVLSAILSLIVVDNEKICKKLELYPIRQITVRTGDVARLLNAATADHLAMIRDQPVKCGVGRCKLNLEAVRTDPAEVRAEGDAIEIALPFAVHAEMAMPGSFSFMRAKANAAGLALTRTTAGIGPDWRIRPHTEGQVRLEDSHLRVGPVVMNLRDVWNDNDGMLSKPLFKMIDKQIAQSVKGEPQIAKLWAKAFTPIKVGKKPLAWLLLSPERIRAGRFETGAGDFVLSLGVDARARVLVQDTPPVVTPTPLPPPAPLATHDDRFAFAVPVLLPYDRAAALAMDSLTKKPPHLAGMTVRFRKLTILPSGQDVILAADFCADQRWDVFHLFSACGTGYLRGVPVFDAATMTVRIKAVRYDIGTENIVLGAIRALSGPALGQDLEKRLVFRVAKDVGKLENQITAALAKPQGRDLTISGDVTSFGAPTLTWTKDGFLASFSAEGTVRTEAHL
jgi:hypothetical protein